MDLQSRPLVSVLMTAYNRERYIGQAIESVVASSYPNWELIIVDDRSKDQTIPIAESYAVKDDRIRIYINEQNLGDYPNRNKAASYARGKYLKYVDADDYMYPWGLDILVTCMEKFPDAGWGLCSLGQIVEQPYPVMLSPKESYEFHYFGRGLFHKAPLSSIIRKSAFEEIDGFSNLRMVGDSDMWHRMAARFPVVLMPDGIVWYREHDSQEINSVRKFLLDYEQVIIRALKDPLCPLTESQAEWVVKRKRQSAFKLMMRQIAKGKLHGASDNWKIWRFYLGK